MRPDAAIPSNEANEELPIDEAIDFEEADVAVPSDEDIGEAPIDEALNLEEEIRCGLDVAELVS